ncbi:MAG: hypothetical protein ACRDD1_01310 [Planctomycetia bacterium]
MIRVTVVDAGGFLVANGTTILVEVIDGNPPFDSMVSWEVAAPGVYETFQGAGDYTLSQTVLSGPAPPSIVESANWFPTVFTVPPDSLDNTLTIPYTPPASGIMPIIVHHLKQQGVT